MTFQPFKRVILIVLDGVGVGALPDASAYGDADAATLPHVAAGVGGLELPNLQQLGLGNIVEIAGVDPQPQSKAYWGKMNCQSAGKDSVTGHWELTGIIKEQPFVCYPEGFPAEIIHKFTEIAGCEPLGNIAASGTDILREFGVAHLKTGRPIVYTSSDSVFQLAAHEDRLPPAELYRLCAAALEMLRPYGLCRVIARPFVGDAACNFVRTSGRHDFAVEPQSATLLELLQVAAVPTSGIGKISDLFAGKGLDESLPTGSNTEGLQRLSKRLKHQDSGLIFVNLVDFDMLYGHRLNVSGFADGMAEFDRFLSPLIAELGGDDLLMITADHGCDPTTSGTDHCREYVPLLAYSPRLKTTKTLGVRESFADVAATISVNFGLSPTAGTSFLSELV